MNASKTHLSVDGFRASINIGDLKATCYAQNITPTRASCWIASQAYRKFSIELDRYGYDRCSVLVTLYMDGKEVDNRLLCPEDHEDKCAFGKVDIDSVSNFFMFSVIEHDDIDCKADDDSASPLSGIGTIKLIVHRVVNVRVASKEEAEADRLLQEDLITDVSGTGSLKSLHHWVEYIESPDDSEDCDDSDCDSYFDDRAGSDTDKDHLFDKRECLAKFTFIYRPYKVLKSLGVVDVRTQSSDLRPTVVAESKSLSAPRATAPRPVHVIPREMIMEQRRQATASQKVVSSTLSAASTTLHPLGIVPAQRSAFLTQRSMENRSDIMPLPLSKRVGELDRSHPQAHPVPSTIDQESKPLPTRSGRSTASAFTHSGNDYSLQGPSSHPKYTQTTGERSLVESVDTPELASPQQNSIYSRSPSAIVMIIGTDGPLPKANGSSTKSVSVGPFQSSTPQISPALETIENTQMSARNYEGGSGLSIKAAGLGTQHLPTNQFEPLESAGTSMAAPSRATVQIKHINEVKTEIWSAEALIREKWDLERLGDLFNKKRTREKQIKIMDGSANEDNDDTNDQIMYIIDNLTQSNKKRRLLSKRPDVVDLSRI